MQDWLQAQMANGFAAFTGAVVTAAIPVKDTLLNELIAGYLAQAREGTSTAPSFDPRTVLPFVRTVTVQAEPGALTVRVELAITDRT